MSVAHYALPVPNCIPIDNSSRLLDHVSWYSSGCYFSNVILPMPTKYVRVDSHSNKPVKPHVTSNTYRFSDGADVQRHLQSQKLDGLTDGEMFAHYTKGSVANLFFSCSPHCTSQSAQHKMGRRAGTTSGRAFGPRKWLARDYSWSSQRL